MAPLPDSNAQPSDVTVDDLIARYDGFLLDAYGVLNDADGPLPGGATFLKKLASAGKPHCVISNDASKSVQTTFERYRGFGLPVEAERIITSGVLLTDYLKENGLAGKRTIVMGTEDAAGYATSAGNECVAFDDESAEVLVVGDDSGYPMLETLNQVVTVLLRRLARGQDTALLVPNPDLVYPRKRGFGVTAGALATMIEKILQLREPSGVHEFVRLGKPYEPIFAAGMQRLGISDKNRICMVGDQLVTDVKGAVDFGIASTLILTGVSDRSDVPRLGITPRHILANLQ